MTCSEIDVSDKVDSGSSVGRWCSSSEKKFSSFLDLPWVSYDQLDFYRSANERRDFSDLCYLPLTRSSSIPSQSDEKTSSPKHSSSSINKAIVDISQYEKKFRKCSTTKPFGRSFSASTIEKNGEKIGLLVLKSNKKMQFKRYSSDGNMDSRVKNSFEWAKARRAKNSNRPFSEKLKTKFSKKPSYEEKLLSLCSGGPLQDRKKSPEKQDEISVMILFKIHAA